MSTPKLAATEVHGLDQAEARPTDPQADRSTKALPAAPWLRALIIGYGSPIRGDDALGPLVADRLQECLTGGTAPASTADAQDQDLTRPSAKMKPVTEIPLAGIEVQARHILTAELVEDLARAERVIFVDAAIDTPPGEVRRRRLAPDRGALSTMAHFHDPRELLAWCEALYHRIPEAWLVSGGGANWDYACYALSETAQQAFDPMLAEVMSLIHLEDTEAERTPRGPSLR